LVLALFLVLVSDSLRLSELVRLEIEVDDVVIRQETSGLPEGCGEEPFDEPVADLASRHTGGDVADPAVADRGLVALIVPFMVRIQW
jgi:hypothetical protein